MRCGQESPQIHIAARYKCAAFFPSLKPSQWRWQPVLGLLVEEGSAQTDRARWLRTTLAAPAGGEWRRLGGQGCEEVAKDSNLPLRGSKPGLLSRFPPRDTEIAPSNV